MNQQEYENEIKELKKRIEKLEAVKVADKGGRWKPKFRDMYYYVELDGNIEKCMCTDADIDRWCYLTGNCFETEEEAEEYKKQIDYTARYKNYIEEHSEPLDWTDRKQSKFGAYYDYDYELVDLENTSLHSNQGTIYASSKQIILDAIKEIGEDNFKKYVLGVK